MQKVRWVIIGVTFSTVAVSRAVTCALTRRASTRVSVFVRVTGVVTVSVRTSVVVSVPTSATIASTIFAAPAVMSSYPRTSVTQTQSASHVKPGQNVESQMEVPPCASTPPLR